MLSTGGLGGGPLSQATKLLQERGQKPSQAQKGLGSRFKACSGMASLSLSFSICTMGFISQPGRIEVAGELVLALAHLASPTCRCPSLI